MLGTWAGGVLGVTGATLGGLFVAGFSWIIIPGCAVGLVVGATVGAVADKVMTSKQKELELKDKQAAAEIAQAQTEGERVATANKALDHNQELFNKISEQLAKKQARNEELKDIIEGNKPLPENTTIEEVKKEYVANQQESAQLLQQLGNVRATMDSLTNIIQSGGKNWDWPTLNAKNIGWGIGLLLVGLFLIGIITRALKKWASMVF
jgi:hypothetical protein